MLQWHDSYNLHFLKVKTTLDTFKALFSIFYDILYQKQHFLIFSKMFSVKIW